MKLLHLQLIRKSFFTLFTAWLSLSSLGAQTNNQYITSKTTASEKKIIGLLDQCKTHNEQKNHTAFGRLIQSVDSIQKVHPKVAPFTQAYIYLTQGNYNLLINNKEQALQDYIKSIKLYEQEKKENFVAKVNFNIALVLMNLKQFGEAEKRILKSKEIFLKLNDWKSLPNVLSTLSNVYGNTQRQSQIIPILEEALDYANKAADTTRIIDILSNKIETNIRLKQADKSVNDIEELERIGKISKRKHPQALATYYKAFMLRREKKYAESIPLYKESLALFKEMKNVPKQREMSRQIAYSAEKIEDFKTANEYLWMYASLSDTLFNENQQKTINELNVKFDTEKKEKQLRQQQDELELAQLREAKAALEINNSTLELKEKEQELSNAELLTRQAKLESERNEAQIAKQNEEIKAANQRQLFLIIGFSALAIFLGLLARQYFATRKANTALAQSNDKIEMMLRELHHRVKNNLQMVSSLFRLQARKMSDAGTAKVLKEGQARVEAMSILHQQLYQNDAITNINLKTYLESLIEKLQYAYGFSEKPFEYRISIEPEEIDVDKALPIGLIVNELLTNSFKYAFEEQSSPAVHLIVRPDYLHYSDNGKGLPESFNPKEVDSFGTRLITSFSQQLKGQYEFWNDKGLNFKLSWKK